jgi:RNA polymerase sigma factor (TIGR02999 family)
MQNALGLGEQPLLCPGVATVQPQETSDQNPSQEAPRGPQCRHSDAASKPAESRGREKAEQMLPLVYQHLRRLAAAKLARERPGQTLQATALVHEAWLRLQGDPGQLWDNQQHFLSAAAEAMRRILIENARRKKAARHGGGLRRTESAPDDLPITGGAPDDELLEVDEALDALAAHDARKAELVKLRYFAGFTLEEAAAALNLSVRTAKRDWAYARAWLFREIGRRKEGI